MKDMELYEWRFIRASVLCTLRPYTAQEGCGPFARTYSFSLMGDGDVFFGFDGTAHHEFNWNLSFGKVTGTVYGAIGWVTVLRHSCGGELYLQRAHLCEQ